jgi:hypothetical protein
MGGSKPTIKLARPVLPYRGTRARDASGYGHFGAPRRKTLKRGDPDCTHHWKQRIEAEPERLFCIHCEGEFKTYGHKGLDFAAKPGDQIIAPFDSLVKHVGIAYPNSNLGSIHLEGMDAYAGYLIKIFYAGIAHNSFLHAPVPQKMHIANAQDLAAYHEQRGRKMMNHIHLELHDLNTGDVIDPTGLFMEEST